MGVLVNISFIDQDCELSSQIFKELSSNTFLRKQTN